MSYHPNIPQANDDPSVSQGQLLDNFTKLNSDFSVNHVPFTAGGNKGFHTVVNFPTVQADDPSVSGLESALYPKAGPTDPELFFRNVNNIFQLTNLPVVNGTITDVVPGANGLVTSAAHGLSTGNMVTIRDVDGITGINDLTFTITVVNTSQFQLNAAVGGGYIGGGVWTSSSSNRYGFFTPWGWIVNMGLVGPSPQTITYSIPYPVGFTFYGGFLTPTTGVSQFGLNTPGNLSVSYAAVPSVTTTFNYLIIGSGT